MMLLYLAAGVMAGLVGFLLRKMTVLDCGNARPLAKPFYTVEVPENTAKPSPACSWTDLNPGFTTDSMTFSRQLTVLQHSLQRQTEVHPDQVQHPDSPARFLSQAEF